MGKTDNHVEEFIRTFDVIGINAHLQVFAQGFRKALPQKLLDVFGEKCLMVDLLKAYPYDVTLPVIVRSTPLLALANLADQKALEFYLHEEKWPLVSRFGLIGGLTEIEGNKTEKAILKYVENSVEHWEPEDKCTICISDRAYAFLGNAAKIDPLVAALPIIELSSNYKKLHVLFRQ